MTQEQKIADQNEILGHIKIKQNNTDEQAKKQNNSDEHLKQNNSDEQLKQQNLELRHTDPAKFNKDKEEYLANQSASDLPDMFDPDG